MSARVERPVTREQHSVSLASPAGASMQTVAGRTPGPAPLPPDLVVAAVFAEFENSIERGGDRHARPRRTAEPAKRLVDVAAPKTSRRPESDPRLTTGGAA